MLRSKVSRIKASGPRKRYITSFSTRLKNEIAVTLLEKDLDAVIHESEEQTEETGSETVELNNGGKLAWFNLKDTAIL